LQEACSRLAPAGVLQRLIADGVTPGIEAAAERKVVTALFADLVGYTALSERLEPAVLARVLNGYFQRMSDAVHEHRGHISTFLGDGDPGLLRRAPAQPVAVRRCCAGGPRHASGHARVQCRARAPGLPPLAVGIGIHRGPGLMGLVGARERMEYGFVGRTVNLAARVQALTPTHQVDILVTEAVRAKLDTRFMLAPMPAELVKGIAEPVLTYAVRECAAAPMPATD
jgi:adenylate cyclase